MRAIYVQGGIKLQGKVRIQGSKNGALPILAAALLTDGESYLKNCPRITDVYQMLRLLQCLGCKCCWEADGVKISSGHVSLSNLPVEAIRGMRSSMYLMGALLGRCGCLEMERPGGCVIGARPIDFHLNALARMGARFRECDGRIIGEAPKGLHGAEITLPMPSVGATENVLLAAAAAEGRTVLRGAAMEPEVGMLCEYLVACGADIDGVGTDCLIVQGTGQKPGAMALKGAEYRIPADRIVAGTYLMACLGAGGNVLLERAPTEQLEAARRLFVGLGGEWQETEEGLYLQSPTELRHCPGLVTGPYPAFPTDMQSAALTALTGATGECLVEETIFENRFQILPSLAQMGADVEQIDSFRAIVRGPSKLVGTKVEAKELRGGAALVLAGLMAEGETKITGCQYIERGYENICRDMRELGARIYCV